VEINLLHQAKHFQASSLDREYSFGEGIQGPTKFRLHKTGPVFLETFGQPEDGKIILLLQCSPEQSTV